MKSQTIELIETFKTKGFEVYAPANLTTYFWLVKGDNIGYCQIDRLEGIVFSTVHKPNRQSGTGFRVNSAEHAVSVNVPHWALYLSGSVKKYKNVNEFLAAQKWCNPVKY